MTDVPLTPETSPRTAVKLAGGLKRGTAPPAPGLALGRGRLALPGRLPGLGRLPAPLPLAGWLQLRFAGLGVSATDVAVTAPVASLVPVAVMHCPDAMSAMVPVVSCVILVAELTVTLVAPLCPLMTSLEPLNWASWPVTALPARALVPAPCELLVDAVAIPPQAATTAAAAARPATRSLAAVNRRKKATPRRR